MTEQQMPARIWCDTFDAALCKEKVKRSHTSYVRSDIAERMAEALQQIDALATRHEAGAIGKAQKISRSALSAFRSATQDTEAGHD